MFLIPLNVFPKPSGFVPKQLEVVLIKLEVVLNNWRSSWTTLEDVWQFRFQIWVIPRFWNFWRTSWWRSGVSWGFWQVPYTLRSSWIQLRSKKRRVDTHNKKNTFFFLATIFLPFSLLLQRFVSNEIFELITFKVRFLTEQKQNSESFPEFLQIYPNIELQFWFQKVNWKSDSLFFTPI